MATRHSEVFNTLARTFFIEAGCFVQHSTAVLREMPFKLTARRRAHDEYSRGRVIHYLRSLRAIAPHPLSSTEEGIVYADVTLNFSIGLKSFVGAVGQ